MNFFAVLAIFIASLGTLSAHGAGSGKVFFEIRNCKAREVIRRLRSWGVYETAEVRKVSEGVYSVHLNTENAKKVAKAFFGDNEAKVETALQVQGERLKKLEMAVNDNSLGGNYLKPVPAPLENTRSRAAIEIRGTAATLLNEAAHPVPIYEGLDSPGFNNHDTVQAQITGYRGLTNGDKPADVELVGNTLLTLEARTKNSSEETKQTYSKELRRAAQSKEGFKKLLEFGRALELAREQWVDSQFPYGRGTEPSERFKIILAEKYGITDQERKLICAELRMECALTVALCP